MRFSVESDLRKEVREAFPSAQWVEAALGGSTGLPDCFINDCDGDRGRVAFFELNSSIGHIPSHFTSMRECFKGDHPPLYRGNITTEGGSKFLVRGTEAADVLGQSDLFGRGLGRRLAGSTCPTGLKLVWLVLIRHSIYSINEGQP